MANEFEKCAKWLLEDCRDGWILCHGFVLGTHHEDTYQHAWLEFPRDDAALLLSSGKPILVKASDYRYHQNVFTIDEFTARQTKVLVEKFKHFGPFDRDLKEMDERILH